MHPASCGFLKMVMVAIAAVGLCGATAKLSGATEGGPGCIACHTDKDALLRNLSKDEPQKSAFTAGAG